MAQRWLKTPKRILFAPVLLIMAFLIACGAAATATPVPKPAAPAAPAAPAVAPTPVPKPAAKPAAPAAPAPTKAPVAAPKATPTPAAIPKVVKPTGTLNMGQEENGSFSGHPKNSVNPQLFVFSTAPVSEGLMAWSSDLEAVPLLAQSWSISKDFLTWTFKLRKGVQFHKDYGEMTSQDVAWSYTQWVLNTKHARNALIREFWQNPKGQVETPDPYTVVVNTGKPIGDVVAYDFLRTPSGIATWITSKKQSEKLGVEAADRDIAGTGPWEIVEHRTGQFWKMRAVENHWRKTPHFAELVFWEIPEEATRLAGFQTGNLDTFVMAFDNIPLVQKVPGARVLRITKQAAGEMLMHFHGMMYVGLGTDKQAAAFDPKLPWVSPNPDLNSPEWDKARKVRQALMKAIDTQTIVDTLLGGFGRPSPIGVGGYSYSASRFANAGIGKWQYDPAGAKRLLAEAGYPGGGFSISLTPAIRGAPNEVLVGEQIATMWGDIGVKVKLQKIPYATLRPQVVGRTYNGASNHATSPSNSPARLYLAILNKGSFVRATHPWLEDIAPRAQAAVDPAERTRLEAEIGRFQFDNVIYNSLYLWDSVWPVGPKIDEKAWSENLFYGDIRNMNGFEYIQPRSK